MHQAMSDWIRAEAQRALDLGKYLGVTVGDVECRYGSRVYNHLRLDPRGSGLRPEMILSALEDFAGARRLHGRRARRRSRPSGGLPASASADPPAGGLEIPAFLRREPAAAGRRSRGTGRRAAACAGCVCRRAGHGGPGRARI